MAFSNTQFEIVGASSGLADDWTIAESSTPSDLGSFNGLGVETFEEGWGTVAFAFVASNLEVAEFDSTLGLETFDASWGPFDPAGLSPTPSFLYTPKVSDISVGDYLEYHTSDAFFTTIQIAGSAPFNTGTTSFETFDVEWSNNDFKLVFVGVGTDLALGSFNTTTPDLFEDFEAEWGNDEFKIAFVGVGTDLDQPTFAPSGTDETFSGFLDAHARLLVNTAISGDIYTIIVDGFTASHTATGGDTVSTIVDALVTAVTNASLNIVGIDLGTLVGVRVERVGVTPVISISCTTATAVQDDTEVAESGAWMRPLIGV